MYQVIPEDEENVEIIKRMEILAKLGEIQDFTVARFFSDDYVNAFHVCNFRHMENIIFDGLIFICDTNEVSGLPIWCSYLQKAVNLHFNVDVNLFFHMKTDLPSQLSTNDRINVHECFNESLDATQFASLLNETASTSQKNVLFFDSMTFALKKFGAEKTASSLLRLIQSTKFSAIVSVINTSVSHSLDVRRLTSIASTVLYLEVDNYGLAKTSGPNAVLGKPRLTCRSVKRKRDGLLSEKFEEYEVSGDNFAIKSVAVSAKVGPTVTELVENKLKSETIKSSEPFGNLPFDIGLNLSESERHAKTNVQLPYLNVQNEKGLVGMNISSGKRIRVGGQIVYTPDEGDDLDDSDPDDDLMI